MDTLLALEPVTSFRDLKGLRFFHDQVEGYPRSLRALGMPSESYGALLAPIIMKRLSSVERWVLSPGTSTR